MVTSLSPSENHTLAGCDKFVTIEERRLSDAKAPTIPRQKVRLELFIDTILMALNVSAASSCSCLPERHAESHSRQSRASNDLR